MKKILLIFIALFFDAYFGFTQNTDSLQKLVHSSDPEQRVQALITLGKQQLYTHTDQSEKYFKTALTAVQKLNHKKWESDIFNQLGVIQYKRSRMDSALYYYQKSFRISKDLQDSLQMAINYSNVANILGAQHKYDLAIQNFLKALPIYKQKNKILYQGMTYGAIGTLHIAMEDYQKALNYFEKAKQIFEKTANKLGLLTTNLNIAICYENLKRIPEAKTLLQQVLADSKKHQFNRKHAIVLTKLGKIAFVEKKYRQANDYYSKALTEFSKARDIGGLAETHLYLGKIAYQNGNFKLASSHYKKSLANIQKTGVDQKSPQALEGIINSLTKLHKEKEALTYLPLLLEAKDSVYNIERRKMVREINSKFDLSQKEKEIQIQQLKLHKKDVQISKQKQLGIALAATIALLLGLLYFVKKSNEFKRLNEHNLIKKNKLELEQKVLNNQMNPHFIFNALNSIQSYIADKDTDQAANYLAKFSRLMRLILENSRKEFVPFPEDVSALDNYLQLEQIRHDDSFDYTIEYEPACKNIMIPPLLIQPFAENAVKHGVSNINRHGSIAINYSIMQTINNNEDEFGIVQCTVQDNGMGIEKAQKKSKSNKNLHQSMSLDLTKKRLKNYTKISGHNYPIIFESDDNGTLITIEMPYIL